MFEIHYYGAEWCGPCKIQKPLVITLGKKYGIQVRLFDIDDESLATDVRENIKKLPTVRIVHTVDGQIVEFVTKQAEQLEKWLQTNVRVNTADDF
jgi:thiol-disulfide isomerase/thioredoxin